MARTDKAADRKVTDGTNLDPEVNETTAGRDRRLRMEAEQAEKANESRPEVYAPYAVEDNDTSAYVGVSPEYMTYANDTEKPLRADEGTPERWEEDKLLKSPEVDGTPLVYTEVSGEGYTSTEKKDDGGEPAADVTF